MAKISMRYICQKCGHESSKWLGKCPECGSFSSFAEEKVAKISPRAARTAPSSNHDNTFSSSRPQSLSGTQATRHERLSTQMPELDRVLGGGVVPGSLVLIGGDPGIGKSTLLIEAAVRLAEAHGSGIYVSGEESVEQIRLRADRLGLSSENLLLAAETDLVAIENHLQTYKPVFAVIDSIQTTAHPALDSAPGTLTQVRESATLLQRIAKDSGVAIFIVGHVNKEGNLAGPRALEHIVDTVLQLEGDEHGQFRILRAAKNRFGSTNELGVFEMTGLGMRSVDNPSQLFLSERQTQAPGSVVVATVEGARPLLVEVQALCSPSYFSSPRRTVTGADFNRVLVVLAVIEKRLGLRLGDMDVYVNVAGGLRVTEPAVDLGIALAVVSSLRDVPIPVGACAFGEIGLAGEVRSVSHAGRRLGEAGRLGLTQCACPKVSAKARDGEENIDIERLGCATLQDAVEHLIPRALERKRRSARSDDDDEARPNARRGRKSVSERTVSERAARGKARDFDEEIIGNGAMATEFGDEVSNGAIDYGPFDEE